MKKIIFDFILMIAMGGLILALLYRATYKETIHDCLKEVSYCEKYEHCDKDYAQWCIKEVLKGE